MSFYNRPMRSEQTIFDELASLCRSTGFIHAVAAICFRDNIVGFKDELRAEDTSRLFSASRLIRTETTTLIGLMMRAPIDLTLPDSGIVSDYIKQADDLLDELHHAIANAGTKVILSERTTDPAFNPFTFGEVLRESIFYAGESAYAFQYRDLAPLKYGQDAEWLLNNKGIDLAVVHELCLSISELLNERLMETLQIFDDKPISDWTMLRGFAFSCDELATRINRSVKSVRAIVEAFTMSDNECNATFTSIHTFNAAYKYPFIRTGPDEFIMFQYYGISEAIYETPFYWMCTDKAYAPTALRHRGEFTEAFAFERLTHVFGADRVFQNVEIIRSKGEILGEIDVLVIFGNRAIVLQAKSKKLTLLARKGNDRQLQSDFKNAVQDSVDQAFACADLLDDSSVTLRCRDGRTVPRVGLPGTIFPISVVADHYPALAFQAQQFLTVSHSERILPPLVIDVFALDAITEMLISPLRLLSYLTLRARFSDKLFTGHELTLLSYHLKKNLWIDSDVDLMSFDDSISSHLDVAMSVRRDGIPGSRTPDGILTRFEGTPFAKIIAEIEDKPNPVLIDLGLTLLELREDTVRNINKYIGQVLAKTEADGGLHDMTIAFSAGSRGLTAHCSRLVDGEAMIKLRRHCEIRKYSQKANCWFGLALRTDGSIRLAAQLTEPWRFDDQMETILATSPSARPVSSVDRLKIGRNHRCPCGSGKKYKHCCIGRRGSGSG